MASYATVDDVKLYIWVETVDAFTEERIEFFLETTKSILDSMIGDLCLGDVEEKIFFCKMSNRRFFISKYNIVEINKIDSNDYSGDSSDFWINGREVYIGNLSTFLGSDWFPFFTLTYSSWFASWSIPKDLVALQCGMVAWELAKENWQEVKSYKVGDVTVNYKDSSDSSNQNNLTNPLNIISNYKVPQI